MALFAIVNYFAITKWHLLLQLVMEVIMDSPKLATLFHVNENEWNTVYKMLFDSPLTHHLDIEIKQYKSSIGFPAFFYYTEEMTLILTQLIKEASNLAEITGELPNIALTHFTKSCLIEEIQSTNEIEGVSSSRKEITAAIEDQSNIENKNTTRLWGIVNKYLKLQSQDNIAFKTSQDLRNFYDDFVLDEVCREDPNDKPDGKIFRAGSVDVLSRTKTIHRGVFPEKNIIAYMDKALAVLQDSSIPNIIRISIYHYLFGYIHPFYNGNGRTSRFITSYYLSKAINPLVAYRLSITIKKSIRIYYKLFEITNSYGNRGDLTQFITGFMWLILKSITRTNELLNIKKELLKTYGNMLAKMKLAPIDKKIYYVLLQAALFSDEGASLSEIAQTVFKHPATINRHLQKYPPSHIVINTSHRAHLYALNLGIFSSTPY